MSFQRSTYTRYLILGNAADHRFQPFPLSFPSVMDGANAPWPAPGFNTNSALPTYDAGWTMGRRINLFFDTPNWEVSSYKVSVQAFNVSSNPTSATRPVLIAPNAILNDPEQEAVSGAIPYYTFLMGNPVYPNGWLWNSNLQQKIGSFLDPSSNTVFPTWIQGPGSTYIYETSGLLTARVGCTAAGEVRLNYSAALREVVGVGSRASTAAEYVVKPTDTIELIASGSSYSNLASNNRIITYDTNSNPHPIIVACRLSNQNTWRLEFCALIDNYGPDAYGGKPTPYLPAYTGLGTYDNPVSTGVSVPLAYVANEIYFVYSETDVRGLAKNNMVVDVRGRDVAGNIVFTGKLYNACNLTYCRNNRAEILNSFKDPAKYLNFTVNDFSKSARPLPVANSITTNLTNSYTFTYGSSANGTQPIKTLAIQDSNVGGNFATLVVVTAEPAE